MEKLTPLISRTEPWEHTKRKRTHTTPDPSGTSRVFDRRKQCWRVFTSGLWQVTLTAAFCAALMGVYYYYSKQAKLSDGQLRNYNAINIGLSLFLGAQLASAFKGFAQNIRWQLLSSRFLELKQFDMVLGCESMITSAQLLWSGRVKGRKLPSQVQWFCAISLLLNLAMQVAVAALGLIVAPDVNKLGFDNRELGNITITDFSKLKVSPIDPISVFLPPNSSPKALANAFGRAGEFSLELQNATYFDQHPDGNEAVFWDCNEVLDFCASSMVLRDCSEPDKEKGDPERCAVTARGVISAAFCETPKNSRFSTDNTLLVEEEDGTSNSLIWSGPQSRTVTTWASDDTVECGALCTAVSDQSVDCDTRCTVVKALVPILDDTSVDGLYHLYECESWVGVIEPLENLKQTIQNVKNTENAQIPDEVARIFASGIAWQTPASRSDDGSMYAQYPQSPRFSTGILDNSSQYISYSIAIFSSFSIGIMDRHGPTIRESGFPPMDQQKLKVDWNWVIFVLIALPATQLILAIIVTLLSSRAVIKDTSFIAAAQLLKPALDDLGSKGSILSGDEIVDHLGKLQLCYGVRDLGSGEYFVDVINRSDLTGDRDDGVWEPGRKMPEGHYDGPET
ncbi:hypothetical protein LTR84_002976 [Exophiala bonariae]|uniref:Uncharacterized protein n=1 Tax=Exophiala bonariae TaxID=1690606 RepID=A0AAV9N7F1_9EURO|nr:hypothetical protein LTR84_002976 [Exophiala bonariae]